MLVQNKRNPRRGLCRVCVGWTVGVGHPWYEKEKSRNGIMTTVTPTLTSPRKGKKREAPVQFRHCHG